MTSRAPRPAALLLFWLKSRLLIVKRRIVNRFVSPARTHQSHPTHRQARLLSSIRSPLFTETDAAEAQLQLGKIQNLRIAKQSLDGIYLPPDALFSFWAQLGRPTRRRGYVSGRELRQGCIIPTIGGGLCQLSNAIYQAATKANCPIVERHAHTQIIPGSAAALGEDATVFWNYVDLRFRVTQPTLLRVDIADRDLVVSLYEAVL